MKIGELARRTGLSVHTIRYYERIGLLPYADRDGSKHRDYGPDSLVWVEFLWHLKATGMPVRDMVHYARLRSSGEGTEAERRVMLEQHREKVRTRLIELGDCLSVLDSKINGYAETEKRIRSNGADTTNSDRQSVETRARTAGPRRNRR